MKQLKIAIIACAAVVGLATSVDAQGLQSKFTEWDTYLSGLQRPSERDWKRIIRKNSTVGEWADDQGTLRLAWIIDGDGDTWVAMSYYPKVAVPVPDALLTQLLKDADNVETQADGMRVALPAEETEGGAARVKAIYLNLQGQVNKTVWMYLWSGASVQRF